MPQLHLRILRREVEDLNLVARIQEALNEDERLANLMPPFPWTLNGERDEVLAADGEIVCEPFALSSNQVRNMAEHFARHDPARVLRQVAAHRKILELHQSTGLGGPWCATCADADSRAGLVGSSWPCPTALLLAEAYGITVEVTA